MQRVRYDISGELCEPGGQYDTNARLQNIVDNFSFDGFDCGLVHDNGDPTTHYLYSGIPENLTGNQVYYKRFPTTTDGEFLNGRKFELGVGALLLDYESEILEHHDSLSRASNAGAQWRWRRNRTWGFYPELVTPNTMQTIAHSGYRVGVNTWPLPITPLYAPPFEQNHMRRVVQHSPQRFSQGYTGYKTSWMYIYRLPTFDDISRPNIG